MAASLQQRHSTALRERCTFWMPQRHGKAASPRVLPVFLPQAGCPRNCIFCDQQAQTGIPNRELTAAEDELRTLLEERRARFAPACELAFYGGTFTTLPQDWCERFLRVGAYYIEQGVVSRMRCSTRPDAVTPAVLKRLRQAGLSMVELGVQSFSAGALQASGRGYAPETAMRACGMVRDAGLGLGIQLLPGLPGQKPVEFMQDLRRAAGLAPELLRLYPCLVLAGAPLAILWRKGVYRPWSLEQAVQRLGRALLYLWAQDIPVGRVGVAMAPGLEEQVLAGPLHPALGGMARSAALFRLVCGQVRRFRARFARPPGGLMVPHQQQGSFWGHEGRWRGPYERLGLRQGAVRFWDRGYFQLF